MGLSSYLGLFAVVGIPGFIAWITEEPAMALLIGPLFIVWMTIESACD